VFFSPFNEVITQIFLQSTFSFTKCIDFPIDKCLFDTQFLKVVTDSVRSHLMDGPKSYWTTNYKRL